MERGGGRGGVSRGMLPLLGLHAVNEFYRSDRKAPVTAGLLVANTLIYLRPGVLHNILPTLDEVWFNPHLILKHRDLRRFFLSPFFHVGESHLAYNMMSLLWKGIQLETSMGSVEFASMIAALVGMSQGITLLLSKSLLLFFDYEKAYYYEHAVGFSGVLFAMKVVLNSQSDNYTNVNGVIVPARYAVWAELILIQMFVPGVSFLGHLGGILAGILYLRLKGSYPGPDPLTTIIRGVTGVLSWPLKLAHDLFRRFGRNQTSGRGGGTVGGRQPGRTISGPWRCAACTYNNSELLNACEMCGTRRGSNELSSTPSTHRSRDLSLEELRRRRIERLALEEVKFLQKQRDRKSGIPAIPILQTPSIAPKLSEKNEGDGEKEELVLQDTFAQETAVMVEDPNMIKYVEQELAKKRGKQIDAPNQVENDLKRAEDELYVIPEHLKVKKRNSEESSTQWTTGIAEVQLPIEYKLRNIEETEAAKKLLQEKRLVGRTKTELSIPSSYSADYFQRGRDYAEKLRREHPELYKDKSAQDNSTGAKPTDAANTDAAGRRQAATDEFMLDRFRKRERHRGMRR